MVAVWAVDIWKDLGDGTWSSTSTVNSDYDIFYRVFNPVDGTFVTDEVRVTDTFASDYVENILANDSGGFTINYNKTSDTSENITYLHLRYLKLTFTASIDKWLPGGGVSNWLDGPSIKLYDKKHTTTRDNYM